MTPSAWPGSLEIDGKKVIDSFGAGVPLEKVTQSLAQNESVLEFFISQDDNKSFLMVLESGSTAIIRIRASRRSLGAWTDGLRRDARKVRGLQEQAYLSVSHMFSILRAELSQQSAPYRTVRTRVLDQIDALGALLFPAELEPLLVGKTTIYLAPHSRLIGLPLHMLPTAAGAPLMDRFDTAYVANAGNLASCSTAVASNGARFLYANVSDEHIQEASSSVASALGISNEWERELSGDELLLRMSQSQSSYVFVHGCTSFRRDWLIRLELRGGIRLTSEMIAASPSSFDGVDVHLFACHSGEPKTRRSRDSLGLITAFLSRQASSVFGCLWPPEAKDAAIVANHMVDAEKRSLSRASAFRFAIRQASHGCEDLERILRFGTFVLYLGPGRIQHNP